MMTFMTNFDYLTFRSSNVDQTEVEELMAQISVLSTSMKRMEKKIAKLEAKSENKGTC